MNRKIRSLLWLPALVAILMTMSAASLSQASEKIVVAVATFTDESGNNLAARATDAVTNTFIDMKYFRQADRAELDKLLGDLVSQPKSVAAAVKAVEAGGKLGARVVVLGSITSAGYNVKENLWRDDNGTIHTGYSARASVTLTVRIVDVQSGEIVYDKPIEGYAKNITPGGNKPDLQDALLDMALKDATNHLRRSIQTKFPLTGRVVKIEGKDVAVDFGSASGVKRHSNVAIYQEGDPMVNLKTGKVIGATRKSIGKGRINEVGEDSCKVKLDRSATKEVKVGDIVVIKPETWLQRRLKKKHK